MEEYALIRQVPIYARQQQRKGSNCFEVQTFILPATDSTQWELQNIGATGRCFIISFDRYSAHNYTHRATQFIAWELYDARRGSSNNQVGSRAAATSGPTD